MPWTTEAAVRGWLGLPPAPDEPATDEHSDTLSLCVAASNALASRYLGDSETAEGDVVDAGRAGACMLAARLHRRRNSPEGVQGFAADQVVYIARTDPDLARLLRIDAHLTPQVG